MRYELEFDPRALKEWQKLGETIKAQFKKKLMKVLENPKIAANQLREFPNCYKIKLRTSGYRLIYQVQEAKITVFVVAIGKRAREKSYQNTKTRL